MLPVLWAAFKVFLEVAVVVAFTNAEVMYTLARLGRFKAIAEQSRTALYAASVHTTFTTFLSLPVAIVYIVFAVTR